MSGRELRRLLDAAGFTREESAGMIGVSRRQLQRWLAGDNDIGWLRERYIREVFGTTCAQGTVRKGRGGGPKRG